jgi:hypothetical protein
VRPASLETRPFYQRVLHRLGDDSLRGAG